LEEDTVEAYLTRRQKQISDNRTSPLSQIVSDTSEYLNTLVESIQNLVFIDQAERELNDHVKILTDLNAQRLYP
jgi:hypothetical protein